VCARSPSIAAALVHDSCGEPLTRSPGLRGTWYWGRIEERDLSHNRPQPALHNLRYSSSLHIVRSLSSCHRLYQTMPYPRTCRVPSTTTRVLPREKACCSGGECGPWLLLSSANYCPSSDQVRPDHPRKSSPCSQGCQSNRSQNTSPSLSNDGSRRPPDRPLGVCPLTYRTPTPVVILLTNPGDQPRRSREQGTASKRGRYVSKAW
jgi:hypothetical protein